MEGEEAFPDFFRVIFSEDIRGAHLPFDTQRIECNEPTPSFVSTKEIQRGTPPPPVHVHAPGLYGDRRRRTPVGLRRFELILEMGFKVLHPILEPHFQWRNGKELFDEQKEGSKWILLHVHSRIPTPLPRTGVERPDSFSGKKRDQCFRLAASVLAVACLHIRIIANDCPEVGTRGTWVALESRHGLSIGLSG